MSFRKKLKCSIKWKFTFIFVALILFLLLVVIAVNSFLLESYYTKDKIKVLESAYTVLDNMIVETGDGNLSKLFPENYDPDKPGSETDAIKYVRGLSEANNLNLVIIDTLSNKAFVSSGDRDIQKRRLNEYILGTRNKRKIKNLKQFDNFCIEKSIDFNTGRAYLESWGFFSDNKSAFIMSMPLASLREAVTVFNRFLISIGIATLIIGSCIVYITSKKITKPINSLALLSEQMSDMDFSARYEGKSLDEIGTLGNSMNKLSDIIENSIGELKTANNRLKVEIENMDLMDKKRQEFVANVSHELKTPIALIQGYAEGLEDGLCEDQESRDYYSSVIVDEAKKMNIMVRELINLSSLEQGKDLPKMSRFDLSYMVNGVVETLKILIEQKNAKVEIDVPENTTVWADEFKIEEVITNYLNNALNHLEKPWHISIYTEKDREGKVYLHVANTGRHIPEEDLHNIWDKFFKVDKAHSREYGGTGLGLSIVHAIAKAHNQECGVKNTRTGVDFWFSLEAEDDNI